MRISILLFLAFLVACTATPDTPTAAPPSVIKPSYELTGRWNYVQGPEQDQLVVSLADKPTGTDSLVFLPHRELIPNTAMWYQQKIKLDTAAYLFVNADDGAQVWQDSQLLFPVRGEYFLLQPQQEQDSILLSIRVLNNAMAGGLRSAGLIGVAVFEKYMQDWAKQPVSDEKTLELPETITAAAAQPVITGTDSSFYFTAWGDSQGGWDTFSLLVHQMLQQPAAFTIGLGDLVDRGARDEQWEKLQQCLAPLRVSQEAYLVAGNHDYDGYYNDLIPKNYLKRVHHKNSGPTYFSWRYGSACFIALDPNGNFPLAFDTTQTQWLQQQFDSEAWQTARWRFLLLHQVAYGQGWPGYYGDAFVQELIDSVAAPQAVDAVLCGHIHDFERLTKTYGSQQTHFIVLGGAGGGLELEASNSTPEMDKLIKKHHFGRFHLTPDTLYLTVIDTKGQILDSTFFTKK